MRKQNAALGFIFITVLIDVIGLGVIIPIMPELMEELTGFTSGKAAVYGNMLFFAFAIMQFWFSPLLGSLSDKYGRRPILLISLFGLSIDYLMHAIAPTYFWLLITRLIAGFCGASATTATAYIADISSKEKRAQNFGMIGVAFGLGFIIGPVIGGVLAKLGLRAPFYFSAGLALLNCLYGFFILPESLKKEHRRKIDLKRANPFGTLKHLQRYPTLLYLFVAIFLLYLSSQSVHTVYSYFTTELYNWTAFDIGLSLGYVGILIALVQGGLIRVMLRIIGQQTTVILGLALSMIGLTMFIFAQQGWMLIVFLVPYCLGGLAGPSIQGLISNYVPNNEQGELQGVVTSLMSLTAILGSIIMPFLFNTFTNDKNGMIYLPGAPFLLGAILVFFSIVFVLQSIKKLNNYEIKES
ncbi:MAG: TCR/Tet family MFS transporter [Bacteroidales bacterium]|nr:TCR/Tet family MFS transporter [Bacteroidales bacterium]